MKRRPDGIWELSDMEMNDLAINCFQASSLYDQKKLPTLSKEAIRMGTYIHDILKKAGHFDSE